MVRNTPGTLSALRILVDAPRMLSGIGPKSAQWMAYRLTQHDREDTAQLTQTLSEATESIQRCSRCNTFTEQDICKTYPDTRRGASVLCVVEAPADQMMIEQTLTYRGQYLVSIGRLSLLNNVGPGEIRLERLLAHATDPVLSGPCTEVILTTNFTSEGGTAAHHIDEMLRTRDIKAARLVCDVPIGGELEYVGASTIARAVLGRRQL